MSESIFFIKKESNKKKEYCADAFEILFRKFYFLSALIDEADYRWIQKLSPINTIKLTTYYSPYVRKLLNPSVFLLHLFFGLHLIAYLALFYTFCIKKLEDELRYMRCNVYA